MIITDLVLTEGSSK